MLHTKSRGNRSIDSRGEEFFKGFYHIMYLGMTAILVQHSIKNFHVFVPKS